MKRELTNVFIDDIYGKAQKKKYETNKIIYNLFDEIGSIDLADMIDYKISNNKGFRYFFIIIDNYSKDLWAITLKTKHSKTITDKFSNVLSKSKRRPLKLELALISEWYYSIFRNFLKSKNTHHCS